jgi:hypothetical protein
MNCRQRNLNQPSREKSCPLFVLGEQKESASRRVLARANYFEGKIAFRISSIRQMIFRPVHGHAEKSGESGNVDEAFDPLHGPSKRGARIRSGRRGCFIHVGVNRVDVRGVCRPTD